MNKIEGNNFGKIENEHLMPYLEHGLLLSIHLRYTMSSYSLGREHFTMFQRQLLHFLTRHHCSCLFVCKLSTILG